MEDLTKQQLILLAALVSFVTSIATGIVTVSLVDQSPAGVTQTINQIVEKTIERVVPVETKATVVTKEIQIPIAPEEALASAVKQVSRSIISIRKAGNQTELAQGILISKDGVIVTNKGALSEESNLIATIKDGESEIPLSVIARNDAKQVIYLKADASAMAQIDSAPIVFLEGDLSLGQNVFTLLSSGRLTVERGIVKGKGTVDSLDFIETDIADETGTGLGLFSISGQLAGVRTKKSQVINRASYLSIMSIRRDLETILQELYKKDGQN